MSLIGPGYVVGGRYALVRLLGRGSMGEVWAAHHQTLGEEVAVKLLAPAAGEGEIESRSMAAARFRFEAQIAARLSRKTRHIVHVTDHGDEVGGLAYLVMELLEGETLEKRLLLRGPLSPVEVSRLVAQIARALEEAHGEDVVHRDLKPANVFLARDEEGHLLAKLLDFGIARAVRTLQVATAVATGKGLVCGTPGYMSPEQACASVPDSRCDLWALATVAYEALTGELPVPGGDTEELLRNLHARRIVPIHQRNPGLPSGVAGFFERAFAADVDQRFATATELARALEVSIVTAPRGRSVSRRKVTRVQLAVVGVGLALLGSAVAARAWHRTPASLAAAAVPGVLSTRVSSRPATRHGEGERLEHEVAIDRIASVVARLPSADVEPADSPEPVVPPVEQSVPRHQEQRGTTAAAVHDVPATPRATPTPIDKSAVF